MECNKCGAGVSLEKSTPHKGRGRFKEKYKCANGHKGWIVGNEEDRPQEWEKFGMVFDD